jgi:hypothetical protein
MDTDPVIVDERFVDDVKRLRAALERIEGGRDILTAPDFHYDDFKSERASCRLHFTYLQHGAGIVGIG